MKQNVTGVLAPTIIIYNIICRRRMVETRETPGNHFLTTNITATSIDGCKIVYKLAKRLSMVQCETPRG